MSDLLDINIPTGYCRCPKCNGSGVMPLTDKEKTYSWNKGRATRECDNCGAQYQMCQSRGYVRPNREGTPCLHSYSGKNVGNCLTKYTCKHCGEQFEIDSGD